MLRDRKHRHKKIMGQEVKYTTIHAFISKQTDHKRGAELHTRNGHSTIAQDLFHALRSNKACMSLKS